MSETNNNPEKVTFDDAQQAKVNQLVQEAMGRASKELKAELDREKAAAEELKRTLEETQRTLDAAKKTTPKGKSQGEDVDIDSLTALLDEQKRILSQKDMEIEHLTKVKLGEKDTTIKTLKQQLEDTRKQTALHSSASKYGFVDMQDVIALTKDSIIWDETRETFIVKGPQGHPRLNSMMEPMSLDEFYQEYAAQKPFLVRSDARSGIGSSETKAGSGSGNVKIESIFGKNSDPTAAAKLMREKPELYKTLRATAQTMGLI